MITRKTNIINNRTQSEYEKNPERLIVLDLKFDILKN